MPRPSLKHQRVAQILDAYENCVARYGVAGATLERIAAEAGLARPLIRHNVGNRDDLLEALTNRFLEKSEQSMQEMMDYMPGENRGEYLVACLFDEEFEDSKTVMVANALISAAPEHPKLAERLTLWVEGFIDSIAGELARCYAGADEEAVYAAATGITGIYFNVDSLSAVGNPQRLRAASKQAALVLLDSLK